MDSGISPIKWTRRKSLGGRWLNDHPITEHILNPSDRYKCYIYKRHLPDSINKYNWVFRDRDHSMNLVMAGVSGSHVTLAECKRRSMLAYIFWFAVMLLRGTDNPRDIRKFYDV